MTTPTLTPPPDAPDRLTQTQPAFSAAFSAFLSWIKTFAGELDGLITWIASTAASIATNAQTASDAAGTATDAASAATAAAGASAHVPGASYDAFDTVISSMNQQTYRAKTSHAGVNTDPSADAVNWTQTTADPAVFEAAMDAKILDAANKARLFSMWTGA